MMFEELIEFRKKLKEWGEKLPEDERKRNIEESNLMRQYFQLFNEGLPYGLMYTFEELKEAVETKKSFREWEKFKDFYNEKLPKDAII